MQWNHNCHEMVQCNNAMGSFNGNCLQGFSGDDDDDCFGVIHDLT